MGTNLPLPKLSALNLTLKRAQGLFQNYISNSKNGSDGAKGLGMGHQAATGLNLFFQWFCYGTVPNLD